MPGNHELNLMLVNTLRKVRAFHAVSIVPEVRQDIHDSSVQRICLALDTVIAKPMEDVIPAVESRLYDLLSHNSSVVTIWFVKMLNVVALSSVDAPYML